MVMGSLSMQMGMYMKDNGRMTKLMGQVITNMQMEQHTMENG
jgi:hypothetical protein